MWPGQVSKPGSLTYESDALLTGLSGLALCNMKFWHLETGFCITQVAFKTGLTVFLRCFR